MIEAVLWDNDGVLVDTETLFFQATRAAFAGIGLELTEKLWARQYLGVGHSSLEIAAFLGADGEAARKMLDERNREYLRVLAQAPPLRPRVRETLEQLRGRVRMAMVTGCHRDQLRLVHASSGLLDFFEVIVTGDECANPKPHPELYLAGLKALGVRAENCIALEDSPRGVTAARAAGVPCVAVPTELTRELNFPGALAIEADVSGILRHI
jgi:HAD superfamily hydrolase (TIGR01509 family)